MKRQNQTTGKQNRDRESEPLGPNLGTNTPELRGAGDLPVLVTPVSSMVEGGSINLL